MADFPTRSLQNDETDDLIPLSNRVAGSDSVLVRLRANSILSSVFVKSADPGASLTVVWTQTTSGTFEEDGEQQLLESEHTTFTIADIGNTQTRLITRIHHKPVVTWTLTGGAMEFGVMGSARAEAASDIDSALQLDASDVDIAEDKGIPTMCYDEDQGKFFFLRCVDGNLQFSLSEAGDSVHLVADTISTPGTNQTLISSTVAAGKLRKVTAIHVSCRQAGRWVLTCGGATIGSGRTGPGNMNSSLTWTPRRDCTAGDLMELKFLSPTGKPASCVEAYLMASDLDVTP